MISDTDRLRAMEIIQEVIADRNRLTTERSNIRSKLNYYRNIARKKKLSKNICDYYSKGGPYPLTRKLPITEECYIHLYPKKYDKNPRLLRETIFQLESDFALKNLEISKFTARTHKDLVSSLNLLNLSLRGFDNKYWGLRRRWTKNIDEQTMGIRTIENLQHEIDKLAADVSIEEMLSNKVG